MNKKQIFSFIDRASKNVNKEITAHANRGGKYASALAGEGYNGGYRDALQDIILLLNDVIPNRQGWWDD